MIKEYENKMQKMFNPDVLEKQPKRGRPVTLTDEQLTEAQKLRDEGYSAYSIAKAFNTSHTTIYKYTK